MKANSTLRRVDLSEYIARLKAVSETLRIALSSEGKDFNEQSVEMIKKARTVIVEICTLCECISEEKYSANTFERLVTLSNELSKQSPKLELNQEFHPIMTDKGVNLISECEETIKDGKTCVSEIREKVAFLCAMMSYRESHENKILQRFDIALTLIIIALMIIQLFWK